MVTLIDLFYPYIPKEAGIAVQGVLDTRWIGQSHRVDRFEEMFRQKFGQKHCISTNSGTSALETAYDLIDIQPGDEVITTPMTCTATNLPLLARGATIRWADIDRHTMNICPNSVTSLITPATKCVVAVNLGGLPHAVRNIPVPLVTDSAQSLGLFNGDYVCNSFQAIKHITTGDGGMLTVPDEDSYKKAKLMRWFGIDREKKIENSWQCYKERQMTFDIETLGYKRHMNDIQAAMGIVGLAHFDEVLTKRGILFNRYKKLLQNVNDIKIIDFPGNTYWLCTVLVKNRDSFAKMLFSYGIDNNLVHLRNDIYKIFGGKRQDLPVMNELETQYICLPLHMNMEVEEVDYICDKISKGW